MSITSVEEIKNRLDIVDVIKNYVKLQKAGVNYRAVCPFHSEKKPSFFVSPARQIWHCFGACGIGGDIFSFVMRIEGVEFGDALKILAQKAGVELKKEDPKLKTEKRQLYEISELACRFFEKQLTESSAGKEAEKYLSERGIKKESVKEWRLGYAPDTWQGLSDFLVGRGYKREMAEKAGLALKSEKTGKYYDRFRGRIIFPIINLSSQPIAFGGRVFKQTLRPNNQEEAKYINSPATPLYDKSRVLYGLNKAILGIRKNDACVLVEGYTDAILAHQAGFTNTAATSGTALTVSHLKILKRYSDNLLSAFDMDIAGDSATKRGINLAQALDFNIKIIAMPKGSDPADILSRNPQSWKNLMENAKTIHDFYFENTLARFDKNTLEGKKKISKVLLPIIKKIPNRVEQTFWLQSLAEKLEVKEEDVAEELEKTEIKETEPFLGNEAAQTSAEAHFPVFPKTRRELLEENLLALILKMPKNLDLIGQEDIKLFSPRTARIISSFKEKGTALDNFSGEEKDFLNVLSLKTEINQEEIDSGQEFRDCFKEIKKFVLKNKLDEISKEIKKAEKEKNFEQVRRLTRQFNGFSKERGKLEVD